MSSKSLNDYWNDISSKDTLAKIGVSSAALYGLTNYAGSELSLPKLSLKQSLIAGGIVGVSGVVLSPLLLGMASE